MNNLSSPSLLLFSIGVSRIGIRHGSHLKRYKKPRPELAGFQPGHGEQIWVYAHTLTNQIIYSHYGSLDSNVALKQLPFNGKKTKPAKLRKDYWKHMALIKFPEGAGEIGRSAYQKLREFRRLHELEWGYQSKAFYAMSKEKRGVALNNQRANAIADMAAVLSGNGRGNLVQGDRAAIERVTGEEQPTLEQPIEEKEKALDSADAAAAAKEPTTDVVAKEDANASQAEGEEKPNRALWPATIYWTNLWDRTWAQAWPESVTHVEGLDPAEHYVPKIRQSRDRNGIPPQYPPAGEQLQQQPSAAPGA